MQTFAGSPLKPVITRTWDSAFLIFLFLTCSLATQIHCLRSGLGFLQHPNDLFF
jgi:hypothetical protein